MTKVALMVCVVLMAAANGGQEATAAEADVTFCFYDTEGLSASAEAVKFAAVVDALEAIDADVVTLASVRDADALKRLTENLGAYPFARLVEAADPERRLAMLAKTPPRRFAAVKDGKYNVRSEKTDEIATLPARRGFAHAYFNFNGYKLHLIGAHLKSRDKHPEFSQTDMRRYEARLLRYYVTDVMKNDPDANILVMGNMNDTCGKSPIKDIYNRRFGVEKQLFDARPLDEYRTSWTFWNPKTDSCERIDYAIISSSLVPEIVREKTCVERRPDWLAASSHRPVVVAINPREAERWSKEKLEKHYPNTIHEGRGGRFENDKVIGGKRQRNAPANPRPKKTPKS